MCGVDWQMGYLVGLSGEMEFGPCVWVFVGRLGVGVLVGRSLTLLLWSWILRPEGAVD
jgi:hypothetical protein